MGKQVVLTPERTGAFYLSKSTEPPAAVHSGVAISRTRVVFRRGDPGALFGFRHCGFDDDLSAGCSERADQLGEGNIGRRALDLGDPRLTCLESSAELPLRQVHCLPLSANRHSELHARVEQLALFVAHFQKVSGVANLPARCFQCPAFSGFHSASLTSCVASLPRSPPRHVSPSLESECARA